MNSSKCENVMIVSRYKENIDWINDLFENNCLIDKCIIINKSDENININSKKIEIIKSDNVGREGETYLTYIINNYENLPNNIWFVQADPFDHSPDFMNLMENATINKYIHKNFQCLSYRYNEFIPPQNIEFDHRFYIDNNRIIQYYIDSRTQQTLEQHEFFDFFHSQKVEELRQKTPMPYGNYLHFMCGTSNIPVPKNIIPYCWSSIFFVKKESIYLNKKSCYIKLREILLKDDNQGGLQGFVLERLWNYILTHNSYDSLEELNKVNWKYSNFCALWNKNSNLVLFYTKSHEIHPLIKKPEYDANYAMIYYNNIDKNYEVKDGIYYIFESDSGMFCLNLQTAKTLLSMKIEAANLFGPISSFGNILSNLFKPATKSVSFVDSPVRCVSKTDNKFNNSDKLLDKKGALALKKNLLSHDSNKYKNH